MLFDFKPVGYEDLEMGDFIKFDYLPLPLIPESRWKRERIEYGGNVSYGNKEWIYLLMSNKPRNFWIKGRQIGFMRVGIKNLKRLEVVLAEDSQPDDIPF